MIFLNAYILWLLIPLIIFLIYHHKNIIETTHIIILILLTISLSRPIFNKEVKSQEIEAKDIIIALDLSFSMNATDIFPNRYDYSKEVIKYIIQNSISDNIMLIGFTTNPLLLSPPTTDHQLIERALNSINRDYILTRGTSLNKLFNKVADISIINKNLILITDGGEENNFESLYTIITNNKINLTTLGLGTKVGTTLKKSDGSLLKDYQGNLVISRVNPILKELSDNYLTPVSTPKDVANKILNIINKNYEVQKILKRQSSFIELYQIPLFLATILFLIIHTRAIKYLIILISLFSTQLNASILDNIYLSLAYKSYSKHDFNSSITYLKSINNISLESQLALANSYYKNVRFKRALDIYKSIKTKDKNIKQQIYYNMANCYTQLKKYNRAKELYIKSLWLGEDNDSLHNLSLVIMRKTEIDALSKLLKPLSKKSSSSDGESSDDESSNSENSSSGSGSGSKKSKNNKEDEKKILIESKESEKQPISSKVYDLINKGYINEKQPW